MKTLTCGTFITDGKCTLLGHSTGNPFWDIPKGKLEDGETPLEAAIRECKEEFDYDLKPENMVDIGRFSYNKRKNIHLFLYIVESFPNIDDLKCNSLIDNSNRPEIDGYRLFKNETVRHHMADSLRRLVVNEKLFEKIKELI